MAESDRITLKHLRMSMEKCKENDNNLQQGINICEDRINGLDSQIKETVDTKVQSIIDEKIADGTMANLTIADGSVTKEKLDPSIKLEIENGSINEVKLDANLRKNIKEKTTIENNKFYYMTFKNWDSTNNGADNWIRFYFNEEDKVVIPTGSEIELNIELELDDINAIDKISFENGNFIGNKIEIVDKFANIIHAKYSTLLTYDLNLANELYIKINASENNTNLSCILKMWLVTPIGIINVTSAKIKPRPHMFPTQITCGKTTDLVTRNYLDKNTSGFDTKINNNYYELKKIDFNLEQINEIQITSDTEFIALLLDEPIKSPANIINSNEKISVVITSNCDISDKLGVLRGFSRFNISKTTSKQVNNNLYQIIYNFESVNDTPSNNECFINVTTENTFNCKLKAELIRENGDVIKFTCLSRASGKNIPPVNYTIGLDNSILTKKNYNTLEQNTEFAARNNNDTLNLKQLLLDEKEIVPMVSFVSDDGDVEDYLYYKDFFKERGITGSLAIMVGKIIDEEHPDTTYNRTSSWGLVSSMYDKRNIDRSMNIQEIREMVADGWTIHAHNGTFPMNYSQVSDDEVEKEVKLTHDFLTNLGFTVNHAQYPQGIKGKAPDHILKYFLSGGCTDGGINTQETNRKNICRWNFNATSIENIKSKIDETISINGWIVFYIHGAEAPNNLSKLDEVITYIKSKGNMEILTYDEAFERMFGRKLLKEKIKTLLELN